MWIPASSTGSTLTWWLTYVQGSEPLPPLAHDRAREISSKRCGDGVLCRVSRALRLPRAVWSKACRANAGRVVFPIRYNHPALAGNGCFGSVGDWVGSRTHRSFGPCIQRYLGKAKELSPPLGQELKAVPETRRCQPCFRWLTSIRASSSGSTPIW